MIMSKTISEYKKIKISYHGKTYILYIVFIPTILELHLKIIKKLQSSFHYLIFLYSLLFSIFLNFTIINCFF